MPIGRLKVFCMAEFPGNLMPPLTPGSVRDQVGNLQTRFDRTLGHKATLHLNPASPNVSNIHAC